LPKQTIDEVRRHGDFVVAALTAAPVRHRDQSDSKGPQLSMGTLVKM
jgi:hypothetical protein